MDRITENLLKEFSQEYGYLSLSQTEQFEHFVNFSVVSREYSESFDPNDVHVGRDSTQGIDGLAIIVNGSLVTDEEEIDDLLAANKYLEVDYIFMQAKTSASFDGADIGSFIEAVRDFFRDQPRLKRNIHLDQKAKIAEHILKYTAKMRNNPTCSLFYITTGKWTQDNNLQARLDQGKEDIAATELFSRVSVDALDAAEIQRLYRQSKEALIAFDYYAV
jgi:hypothetical protein